MRPRQNSTKRFSQQLASSLFKAWRPGRVSGSASQQVNAAHMPGGFTIAELLIATAIFSVILTGALVGFIQIGRMFYKGVSLTQTQDATKQVINSLRENIQLAASVSASQTGGGYSYYCVGNHRYTYKLGQKVELSDSPNHAATGNFGLLHDILPGSSACATPCAANCGDGAVAFNNPTELLGNKMRLGKFDIIQPDPSKTPGLYNLDIAVVYGEDDILNYTNKNDPSTAYCSGSLTNQQFCAVNKLSTTVYRGLHP
ncbi:MAG: prepilin-type N-terminal cleavage/methylation domain-containing protein [Candidatus Saccharimonadales bacterium]